MHLCQSLKCCKHFFSSRWCCVFFLVAFATAQTRENRASEGKKFHFPSNLIIMCILLLSVAPWICNMIAIYMISGYRARRLLLFSVRCFIAKWPAFWCSFYSRRGEKRKRKSELWEREGVAEGISLAINTMFGGNFPTWCYAEAARQQAYWLLTQSLLAHYLHLLNATNRCSITVPPIARIASPKLIK